MNSADEEIDLIPGGRHIPVLYEERHEYVERMIHARMTESNKQVFVSFFFFSFFFFYYGFNNVFFPENLNIIPFLVFSHLSFSY